MNRFFSFGFALLLAMPAAAATWDIDVAHSEVGFVVKHLVVAKVRGRFNEWSGTVKIDEADITKSSVEVKIKCSSIDTGTAKRDDHLRGPDFFDCAKFPDITFKSTKVEKQPSAGALKVTGDLTIRGVTKPVVLDVTGPSPEFKDPGGNPHIAFSATTKLNRQDFGVKWNNMAEAGPVVSNEVAIEIEAELKNKR